LDIAITEAHAGYVHSTKKGQHEAAEKIGHVMKNLKLGCNTLAVQNKKDSTAEATKS